ncbi:hypothetical protein MFIFM68171_09884 [Madurella fahalii]|uniref:Uncharacterized protein n=1 Tax=Madurella fahalii TaxID=1157608 RepID=A0ABQ0GPP0_9PEZI
MSTSEPPRGAPAASKDDDDDPIVASYSVFLKPPLPEHRNLVVFQYVTKTAQDPGQVRMPRVMELRVKPSTGMYEVDVPIDTMEAYDRNKGMAWGAAMKKSMETKKGGSLGLAGGFNIAATPNPAAGRGGRRGAGASNEDDGAQLSWAEAVKQDKVLRAQTFGGGRSAEQHTREMVGVFQGKNIHLTPISHIVQLRPVPHHLDAATEQERLARAPPSAGGGATSSTGAAATATTTSSATTGAGEKAAGRAIHMALKSAMDESGGVAAETMADRLRRVQTESWRRMEWVHDEAELAWEAYNECLLMRSDKRTAGAGDDGGDGRAENGNGKGKEPEELQPGTGTGTDGGADDSGAPDLAERVARLRTEWGEAELLQAISTVRRPTGSAGDSEEDVEEVVKPEPGAGRSGAASGTAAPKRGAGTRAASRGGTMEID